MKQRVIGPRGGKLTADVSCYTCLCGRTCTLLRTTKEFGCGDWIDEVGNKVDFSDPTDVPPGDSAIKDCVGCGKCEDVLEPPPIPMDMESAAPLQRELNKLQSARIENLSHVRHRIEHVREEIEAERVAPPDTDGSDVICESCGDPDCSRPFPHPTEEDPNA